jgi:hypothetical protein
VSSSANGTGGSTRPPDPRRRQGNAGTLRRLRPKRNEPATNQSVFPYAETVYAVVDVAKSGRLVRRGDPLRRDHVMVRELPEAFEVRYALLEEVKTNGE